MRSRRWILAAAFATLTSGHGYTQAPDKIPVVATFSILADMTQRIGGGRIDVQALVGPQEDAHVFQPSPAAAATVARARLVVSNGLGFEGWIGRLVSSTGYKGPVIIASEGVNPIATTEDGHSDTDPHAWQDMSNALVFANNIMRGLCSIDAAGCPTYTENTKSYSAEIESLHTDIKSRIGALPASKRKVITSHDAFGYFAKAYGVTFISPIGLSTESEASAKDVAKLIGQIKSEKVTALFLESISDTRLIEQIARETGVKPGAVLYSDALSPPDGPAATYLGMMRHNSQAITAAMAGS